LVLMSVAKPEMHAYGRFGTSEFRGNEHVASTRGSTSQSVLPEPLFSQATGFVGGVHGSAGLCARLTQVPTSEHTTPTPAKTHLCLFMMTPSFVINKYTQPCQNMTSSNGSRLHAMWQRRAAHKGIVNLGSFAQLQRWDHEHQSAFMV
jgi:hypothetical protein